MSKVITDTQAEVLTLWRSKYWKLPLFCSPNPPTPEGREVLNHYFAVGEPLRV